MVNSTGVARYGGTPLAESSNSTGSTSSASSSSSSTVNDSSKRKGGMGNDGTTVGNTGGYGGSRGYAGGGFASASSSPRLPAVPLLTEKQQQLLLRYLCISNDETSRMLMQAAARQHSGSAKVREFAATAAVAGLKTPARERGDTTAGAAAVSHDLGGTTAARKSRAAARASCSSPVSPFAAASNNNSNHFHAGPASRRRSSAFTETSKSVEQQGSSCWKATSDADSFRSQQQQQVSKGRNEQQDHVLILRSYSGPQEPQQQQRAQEQRQPVAVHQHQQEQQQQVQLRTSTSEVSPREHQGATAAVPALCPLRPCLRRRSNVRFRSPVAVDLSVLGEPQQHQSIAAAPREASGGPRASSSEASTTAAEAVAATIKERRRASFCCSSSCMPPPCCYCRTGDLPDSRVPLPRPEDSAVGSFENPSGPAEGTANYHAQLLHCCCCCSTSAPRTTSVHVSGLQCYCPRLLREDGQAAAASRDAAQGRGFPAVAASPPLASTLSPPTPSPGTGTGVCRHQCDADNSAGDHCKGCCRGACCSSSLRGALCSSCCYTCFNTAFCVDEASSTSLRDGYEESSFPCAAGSRRRRRARCAAPAVAADAAVEEEEEEAAECRQEELPGAGKPAATAAKGAAGQARATGGATARSSHKFCRHLPSHEGEGPRPCCGPGICENETALQLPPRAYEGELEEEEEVCSCCCCRQQLSAAEGAQHMSPLVASNPVRKDMLHSCFHACAPVSTPACPVLGDVRSAPKPVDVVRPVPQQEQAAAAPEAGSAPPQFACKCTRLCCGQREQQLHRHRLPVCCCRQALHTFQGGKEEGRCVYSQRPRPAAAATTAGEPPVSCPAGRPLGGSKSASPALLLHTMQQHLQTERCVAHAQRRPVPQQQKLTHAPRQHRQQWQQQLNGVQLSDSGGDLQPHTKEEHRQHTSTYRAATSTLQADVSSQTQEEQQLHMHRAAPSGGRSGEVVQRHCIYLRPASGAVDTTAPAAGRTAAAGAHTPSTSATFSGVTPPATPAHAATPTHTAKEAVPVKAPETAPVPRLTRASTRPGAPAAAARTLTTGATATPPAAVPAVAAVQTTTSREEAATAWRPAGRAPATTSAAARGIADGGVERVSLLEEIPLKASPAALNRRPFSVRAHPLADNTSPELLDNSSFSQELPSTSAGVEPRTFVGEGGMFVAVRKADPASVSGVTKSGRLSGFSDEPVFNRGEGGPVASLAGTMATATAATAPAAATSVTVPTDAPRAAAGFAELSAVAGVGGSTPAPTANGTATWCETRLDEEQDLQQLLQRQQQELAEQLRRLDYLEKRQRELRQPQLQRRQDWWQRLQALEQQLQRQKVSLEQRRHERGLGMLQNIPRQQLGEQQHINGGGVTKRFAVGHYDQRCQVNGEQQPADNSMPQSQQQQRRGNTELHAVGGLKGELCNAAGTSRPSVAGSANLFYSSPLFHKPEQRTGSVERSTAAPASLLVLSKSTRKFQPPQPVQQQQQQRHHQQEERHQQQQRRQQHGGSEKWPSQQNGSSAVQCGVASWRELTCTDICRSDQHSFTVESEQLLLDEDEEEQELLELQEISEALEAAEL